MNRILVVDDNEVNGILIKELLEKDCCQFDAASMKRRLENAGDFVNPPSPFSVDCTLTGEGAIKLVSEGCILNEPYFMAFVDLTLKGMSGMETAQNFRKLDGNIKIVFISGMDFDVEAEDTEYRELETTCFFLQKPFSFSEVRQYAFSLCDIYRKEVNGHRKLQ